MTFLILAVSACAIVLLTNNHDGEDSKLSIVTSVSIESETSSSQKTSKTNTTVKNKSTKNHKNKSNKTSRKNSSATTRPTKTTTEITVKFPIDINKATKNELMEIDGVGEVIAKKIISHKKSIKYYSNLSQLKDISGIGDATYEKLKKYLYVSKDKYKDIPKEEQTSYSRKNSDTTTKMPKYSIKAEKQMKIVNINTAGKEELEECLLIDEKEALDIIKLREQVGGKYTNTLELLMTMEDSEYNRIKDYVTV